VRLVNVIDKVGVALTVSAAAKGMLKQYDCACFRSGYLVSHYKACQLLRRKQTAILLAIRQMITIWSLSSRAPGQLSVTESLALPPQPKGGHMPKFPAFNLSEWLVPPVLMPIFLVLLVAAAMVIQW
jgi:hypothetical protein